MIDAAEIPKRGDDLARLGEFENAPVLMFGNSQFDPETRRDMRLRKSGIFSARSSAGPRMPTSASQ